MLRKQADALAESVTDLLVRQKQISLGVPSMWGAQRESIISVRPLLPPSFFFVRTVFVSARTLFCYAGCVCCLVGERNGARHLLDCFPQVPKPPAEIQSLIEVACGDDPAVSVLTQELLVYLGM
jgi:hypothetical protein